MIVNVFEKVVPAAVKALGKPAVIELVGLASLGAGGVNFVLDKTVGPVADKLTTRAKDKVAELGENRKAKLEQKKAILQALQQQQMIKTAQEVETVEKKPDKTSNTKKNK